MKLRAFRVDDKCQLDAIAASELSLAWLEDPIPRWIDIEAASPDELRAVLTPLPNAIEFGDILDCKERVDRLTLMCEDQLDCVSLLRSAESQLSPANRLREHFRDMVDGLRNAQTGITRLGTQVQDLRQQYAQASQDMINKRLNFLAVLSAVYLPAALVSGIFGMNFDNMPALHMHYGYFVALGAMLVLVIGQLIFFRKRGWF